MRKGSIAIPIFKRGKPRCKGLKSLSISVPEPEVPPILPGERRWWPKTM